MPICFAVFFFSRLLPKREIFYLALICHVKLSIPITHRGLWFFSAEFASLWNYQNVSFTEFSVVLSTAGSFFARIRRAEKLVKVPGGPIKHATVPRVKNPSNAGAEHDLFLRKREKIQACAEAVVRAWSFEGIQRFLLFLLYEKASKNVGGHATTKRHLNAMPISLRQV